MEGSIEALVFSTQYDRLINSLVDDKAVLVRGLVLPEEGAASKISIQDVVLLDNARVNLPSVIRIKVPMNGADQSRADELQTLFERKPGNTEVRFELRKSKDFAVIMDVTNRVRPDKEFKAEIARICGSESLEILAE